MRITNTLSEILWVMVTGAPTGTQGALYFSADLWATHFNGSFFGEYIDSWSSITGAINIATPAWLPQGSTPISCYGTGSPCIASFVFGIPTELTFDSTSHVSYVYGGLQNPGGPIFAGYSVVASASLGPPTAVYSYSQNGLLSDATIAFASVPEPATLWLARMAQSLC